MEWCIYNYIFYSNTANGFLLYSSLSNKIIKLNKDGYDTLMSIKRNPNKINVKDKNFRFLFEGRFIVNSNESEINKIKLSTLSKRFNPDFLSLTIAPTRACNFNCPYCYEKNRINKSMPNQIQDGIIEFVRKKEHLKSLQITWYGGEPTLQIDTIKYLSSELQKIVPNYNAFMVTNAYLLDAIADYIDDLNIHAVQVTLDGTEETHNATRCLKNGEPTFDKILSNIDLIVKKSDKIQVSIRMNISTDNSNEYVKLYKLLNDRYPKQVHLYPAFVQDYGGCQADFCFDNGEKKATFLKRIFKENGVYTKDMYPFRINKGCMIQTLNAYVIGPDGELYKCWHHLGNQEKIIGNILTPGLINNFELLSNLMMGNDSIFDKKCLKCVLFPSCDGGCSDIKSTKADYCIPAKSMIEDMIDARYVIRTNLMSNK